MSRLSHKQSLKVHPITNIDSRLGWNNPFLAREIATVQKLQKAIKLNLILLKKSTTKVFVRSFFIKLYIFMKLL